MQVQKRTNFPPAKKHKNKHFRAGRKGIERQIIPDKRNFTIISKRKKKVTSCGKVKKFRTGGRRNVSSNDSKRKNDTVNPQRES